MLFSIIIPTYNREQYLRHTLDTIWLQTFTDFEIIVVDDGSSDGTAAYMASLQGKVSFLQQSNAGPGAARNLGMKHAKGEYLAFLDSDDLWFPWTLETYADVIKSTSKPAFIAGNPLLFRSEMELAHVSKATPTVMQFKDYLTTSAELRWLGASAFVVQREAMLKCGGFAEKNMNAEDTDLAIRLGTSPGFVQITGPVTLAYRQHAANVTAVLEKTLTGLWHIIRTENTNSYPGGAARARDRQRMIACHARPIILTCLSSERLRSEGWRLYRATFRWQVAAGRWRFLLGFPLKALMQRAGGPVASVPA